MDYKKEYFNLSNAYDKIVAKLNKEIKEKQQVIESLIADQGEYARQFVKEDIAMLEQKYKDNYQDFIKATKDEDVLMQKINKHVFDLNQQMIENFIVNTFQKVMEKYDKIFFDNLKEHLDIKKYDNNIKNYVESELKRSMKKFKTDEIEKVIKFIVIDTIKKANIDISKTILNEMSEMQTIQLETYNKAMDIVKNKEKEYIESSYDRKVLQIGTERS